MSSHVVESTSELSAFMKAGVMMAGSERDAGFCSGGDEDDMSGLHSPSASEDSVEVQVTPISLRNKRKLAEPRKIQEPATAPPKKRRFEQIEETAVTGDEDSRPARSPSPFRPWSSSKNVEAKAPLATSVISLSSRQREEERRREDEDARNRTEARISEAASPRLREPVQSTCAQNRPPTSLVQRRESRQKSEATSSVATATSGTSSSSSTSSTSSFTSTVSTSSVSHVRLQEEPLSLVLRGEVPRVPSHPAVSGGYEKTSSYPMELPSHHLHHQTHQNSHSSGQNGHQTRQQQQQQQQQQQHQQQQQQQQGGQQRNYKNMTRERRIEANARERTRVHTISAAFDTLRRAIPAYSHNQKLSKLSVLRIACSYIMTLGKIVNTPEGESANGASLGACVDLVSRTIQTEGKLRKRKED